MADATRDAAAVELMRSLRLGVVPLPGGEEWAAVQEGPEGQENGRRGTIGGRHADPVLAVESAADALATRLQRAREVQARRLLAALDRGAFFVRPAAGGQTWEIANAGNRQTVAGATGFASAPEALLELARRVNQQDEPPAEVESARANGQVRPLRP